MQLTSKIQLFLLKLCGCVSNYGVNIRGHAFAANWIEQFRHMQSKEAAKKKALRKDLKNMKI